MSTQNGRAEQTDAASEGGRHLGPEDVRLLGHPVRIRIIDALATYGPATATQLAQRLGGNSGTTSYHLRKLASRHIVVPDDRPQVGKERWWRLPPGGIDFTNEPGSPEALETGVLIELFTLESQRALDERYQAFTRRLSAPDDTQAAAWAGAMISHSNTLRLTPAELRAMGESLQEFLDPWWRASQAHDAAVASGNDDPDAETVSLSVRAFPVLDSH